MALPAKAARHRPAKPDPVKPDKEAAGQLIEVAEFGSNPGHLSMLVYRPARPATGAAPLIVVLHGCGQDAVDFAVHAEWTAVADRLGLTLILPGQSSHNNQQRCFQWFRPAQVGRGLGEAASIHQMVETAIERFGADRKRVYIVGLSAGAAMAAALLAAYPETFAAGAAVAGLPVGAANGAASALARMAQAGPDLPSEEWAGQVRRAAPPNYGGPWPRLSIWHGGADTIVDPANSRLLAAQWCAVHGLADVPTEIDEAPGIRHESWGSPGQAEVELWSIAKMPHGYPVDGVGLPSAAILPAGIGATPHITRFWGLG